MESWSGARVEFSGAGRVVASGMCFSRGLLPVFEECAIDGASLVNGLRGHEKARRGSGSGLDESEETNVWRADQILPALRASTIL